MAVASFRRVSLAPLLRRKLVADLGFVRAGGRHPNAAVADQLTAGPQDNSELILDAGPSVLKRGEHPDELLHLRRGPLRPFVVAQVERIFLVRKDGRPIALFELAQLQPFGCKLYRTLPRSTTARLQCRGSRLLDSDDAATYALSGLVIALNPTTRAICNSRSLGWSIVTVKPASA